MNPNYTLRRIVALFALVGFVVTVYWAVSSLISYNLAHPCVRMIADYCIEGN